MTAKNKAIIISSISAMVIIILVFSIGVLKHHYPATAKEKIATINLQISRLDEEKTVAGPGQINLWINQLNGEKTKTEKEVDVLKKRLNEKKLTYNRYRKNGDPSDSNRCQQLVNEVNLIADTLAKKESILKEIDNLIGELNGVLSEAETRGLIAEMSADSDIIKKVKNGLEVKKLTDNTGEKPFVNYQSAEDLDKFMAVPVPVITVPSSVVPAPVTRPVSVTPTPQTTKSEALVFTPSPSSTNYVVDLDADPKIPAGFEIVEHIKGGQFKFDPVKIVLYLDEGQQKENRIVGTKLREKLKDKPVYNANLLDFYLAHQELIPKEWNRRPIFYEEWSAKAIFFWGTIYRDSQYGTLYVRYLVFPHDKWVSRSLRIDSDFRNFHSAAVRANN